MRYGIFSDVHSNLEALEAVLAAYRKESVDAYFCAGDIVGYAVDPAECIERLRGDAMLTVAGNHDWASTGLMALEYFSPVAREALTWTGNNLSAQDKHFLQALKLVYSNEGFTLVHGTLDKPEDFNYLTDAYLAQATLSLLKTDICFVGHTHVPAVFIEEENGDLHYQEEDFINIESGSRYIVNVGSVGQPRDGNPKAAFCVYDSEKKTVQIKRVEYDFESAREKIIEAGLPQSLGDRLLSGR